MKTIEAVIFDMDGILINSEPFWRYAEMEIFASVGLEVSYEQCGETAGLRIDEVVDVWFDRQPWKGKSKEQVTNEITTRVIEMVKEKGEALPGVLDTLEKIKHLNLPIGLASSSSMDLINAVVDRLSIRSYFKVLQSAEVEKYGKPHPDVFIHCAENIGVSPLKCLVFEDSFNGVLAALAARMKVIAIPEEVNLKLEKFNIADIKLQSMEEFQIEMISASENVI